MTDWIIAVLLVVVVAQFVVYHLSTQKLVNKLMSRNFYEYHSVQKKPEPIPKVMVPDDAGPDEGGVLDELNKMIL